MKIEINWIRKNFVKSMSVKKFIYLGQFILGLGRSEFISVFFTGSVRADRNGAEVREGPAISVGGLPGAFEERAFLELRRPRAAV